MKNGSDKYPIELDFGILSLDYYNGNLVVDGNHRLFAAVLLRKEWIYANCSGEVKEINKYKYKSKNNG